MTAEQFKAWRNRLGLSQAAAGEALGLHRHTIRNYETGFSTVPKHVELACREVERAMGGNNG